MSNNKLQTLKGFRDFLPAEKRKRDFVLGKIVEVFERFGFEPLETPTLEYAELLLGKYGTEADKLIYTFKDEGGREVGLRYDQTVPTSRVLAQYQQQLPKYFRRYQIQNVFRAERPQKGRFREFTQCDIDIFGSTDPLSDAEIVACTYFAFKNVGFSNVELKLNDRKILIQTLSPFVTEKVNIFSIIQSIDKLDKLEPGQVVNELAKKGLSEKNAANAVLEISGGNLRDDVSPFTENIRSIIDTAKKLGVPGKSIGLYPTIARGLDYYTGMIFEVSVPEYGTNSLGGGGRYDDLIEQLGGVSVPAVGIAFGFDRMVEAAGQLGLISTQSLGTQVLVTVFNNSLLNSSIAVADKLRQANVATELFPNSQEKLDKQLKYADRKGIPYVVIVGPNEAKENKVKLKDMRNQSQSELTVDEVIAKLKS